VVYGNAADIAPNAFILDRTIADGSMMDQEALRVQVDAELNLIQRFGRLYQDIDSLPLANRVAAPVDRLTSALLDSALNEGPHFLSLSGHGSQWGCCMLGNGRAASVGNRNKFFIAWADSCLTNAFESNDAMAEDLLNNPNGGAVAYIGHTRFSWIGIGDDYQRAFFHQLVHTRHLGLMFNSRLNLLAMNPHDHYQKWTALALNLLGDPEMEVWKAKPKFILPDLFFFDRDRLHLKVYDSADFARKPLEEYKVMLHRGETVVPLEISDEGVIRVPPALLERNDATLMITAEGALPYILSAAALKRVIEKWERSERDNADVEIRANGNECGFIPDIVATTAPVSERPQREFSRVS
jgi:hypothetical protein